MSEDKKLKMMCELIAINKPVHEGLKFLVEEIVRNETLVSELEKHLAVDGVLLHQDLIPGGIVEKEEEETVLYVPGAIMMMTKQLKRNNDSICALMERLLV